MLQNNNGRVIWHLAKNSLTANKLRNRFMGIVIIMSAFLLSFSSTFGFNAYLDVKYRLQSMNIDSSGNLSEMSITIIVIAVIIFLACVLAVYNIFYISIMQRTSEYGQLRAIGTTTRQIRKIVLREGIILSVQYIPFGIVVGCLASYIISPAEWYPEPSIACALISCGITFFAVIFSVIKPARMAASVSPIEAVKYTGYTKNKRKNKKTSKHLSPVSLGMANVLNNKKKFILTFLSLTLSGILFIGAASVMNGVNPAERAKDSFLYGGEYRITLNGDLISSSVKYNDLQIDNPLSDHLMAEILQIEGINRVETNKYIRCSLAGDNHISTSISSTQPQFIDYLIAGSLDDTGIVINCAAVYYENFGKVYNVGDNISLILADGNNSVEMSFQVCGIIDNKNDGGVLFLPPHIMDDIMTENSNISFEILSEKGYSIETANALKSLIQNEERLSIVILNEEIAYYKSVFHTITAVLYAFVAFIGIFAIVNLINTIITNALSRKKEIGIMQAVGLDKKQFRIMLRIEHGVMLIGSFAISLLVGGYGGYKLCDIISNVGGLSFVQYQFPIWQITVYCMLIIAVQIILTAFLERSMSKQSIVERLYQP